MSDAQNLSEEAIFSRALECSGSQREAYLDQACSGRPELRERIARFLGAQEQLGQFMERPPLQDVTEGNVLEPSSWVAELRPGDTLGRYKLLQKLGEGSYGIVYMAEQLKPVQRRVAVKVLKLGMDTKAVLARFEAERQALAMMDHPNIAKVFDADTTASGRPYFVMELVRGIRITDFCNQNHLSTQERLELVVQICHAIEHAHQKGIIHRDLKPSNLLVTIDSPGARGSVKIIDFGIAKAIQGRLTDQTLFTAMEQLLGTPAYMSPEQTLMTTMDIDTRSDVYSIGVLLYELLTGTTPFPAKELLREGIDAMRRVIQEQQPPLPSTRLGTLMANRDATAATFLQMETPKLIHLVRGDLDWIVMKCLEKDRNRRYGAASALAADLLRHLGDEPVEARPPSPWYHFQKSLRRHSLAYAAALAVLVSLTAGAGLSLWQANRAKRAEGNQRRIAYTADMNLARIALDAGDLGQARTLLARYSPKPGVADLRHWEWNYLASQCEGDELDSLPGHDSSITTLRFLDSKTLISTDLQHLRTKIWDLRERTLTHVLTNVNHGGGIGMLVLNPEAREVYYCSAWKPAPHVYALDLTTGKDRRLTTMQSRVLSLSFDAHRQLLAIGSGQSVTFRPMSDPATEVPSVKTAGQAVAVDFSPVSPLFAVVDSDGAVVLRNLETGSEERIPAQSAAAIGIEAAPAVDPAWWCRFKPDGNELAFGSGSRLVQVCDLTRRSIRSAFRDTQPVVDASFSPDGKHLATVGGDAQVRLHEWGKGAGTTPLRGHVDRVQTVCFSPEGSILASGSRNGEIKLWSTTSRKSAANRVALPRAPLSGIIRDGSAFWRVGQMRTETSTNGLSLRIPFVEVFSAKTLQPSGSFDLAPLFIAPKETHDFTALGQMLCIGTTDGRIHLRQSGASEDLAVSPEPSDTVNRTSLTLDGSHLVTLDYYGDWKLRVWHLPEMRLVAERRDLPDVHEILLSEDGERLAVFTGKGEFGVLQMPTLQGGKLRKVAASATQWNATAFSRDNRQLAAALGTGQALIWNLETGESRELQRSATVYGSLAFTSDGSRVAASDAHGVRLFETQSASRLLELQVPEALVAFSRPDDALLIVGADFAQRISVPSVHSNPPQWLHQGAQRLPITTSNHE